MTEFTHDALIFVVYMIAMLLKDIVYTIETKADANNNVLLASIADPVGDGLASVTTIMTVAIIAAGLSRGGEIAQVVGNMAGGFLGVYAGNHISSLLDKLISGYHKRPNAIKMVKGQTVG